MLSTTSLRRFIKELPHNLNTPWTSISSLLAGLVGLYPGIPDQWRMGMIAGLFLIVFLGAWQEWQERRKYQKTAIAIPFVINIANPADTVDALHKLFAAVEKDFELTKHSQNLKEYLHIGEDDLYLKYNSTSQIEIYNRQKFERFLAVLIEKIDRLNRLSLENMTLCIAIIAPASAAIAIGTYLSNYKIDFYHRETHRDKSSPDRYIKVIASGRDLKERVDHYTKFNVSIYDLDNHDITDIYEINNSAIPPAIRPYNATLALDISTHKINLNESSIKSFGDTFYMQSKGKGTIEPNEDWSQYCREIFKALNLIQQKHPGQKIRLAYSMPTILGLALGTIIQRYWNITLTNYEPNTGEYKDFIHLQEIKINI